MINLAFFTYLFHEPVVCTSLDVRCLEIDVAYLTPLGCAAALPLPVFCLSYQLTLHVVALSTNTVLLHVFSPLTMGSCQVSDYDRSFRKHLILTLMQRTEDNLAAETCGSRFYLFEV